MKATIFNCDVEVDEKLPENTAELWYVDPCGELLLLRLEDIETKGAKNAVSE